MSSDENLKNSSGEINVNSDEFEIKEIIIDTLSKQVEPRQTEHKIEHDTTNKEDYQIEICQDGKYAVTLDTGKFHYIKSLVLLFDYLFFLFKKNYFFLKYLN